MNYKEDYIKLLREHRDLAMEYIRTLKERKAEPQFGTVYSWTETQCKEEQPFTNTNYSYHVYYTGEPAIQGNEDDYLPLC